MADIRILTAMLTSLVKRTLKDLATACNVPYQERDPNDDLIAGLVRGVRRGDISPQRWAEAVEDHLSRLYKDELVMVVEGVDVYRGLADRYEPASHELAKQPKVELVRMIARLPFLDPQAIDRVMGPHGEWDACFTGRHEQPDDGRREARPESRVDMEADEEGPTTDLLQIPLHAPGTMTWGSLCLEGAPQRRPRTYQDRAAGELHAWYQDADQRAAILTMPTGSGKTFTVLRFVIDTFLRPRPEAKILWVAHRSELLEQAMTEYVRLVDSSASSMAMGVWKAGTRCLDPAARIIFASWQTLQPSDGDTRTLHELQRHHGIIDLVVVDECHHGTGTCMGSMVEAMLRHWKVPQVGRHRFDRVLGITATPFRDSEDSPRNQALRALFGNRLINPTSLVELVRSGALLRPIIENPHTGFQATINPGDIDEEGRLSGDAAGQFANSPERDRKIVALWEANRAAYGPTIVFAATCAHGRRLRDRFARIADTAYVDGTMPDRRDIVSRFREGGPTAPQVLINVNLLFEGYDAPRATTAIVMTPMFSPVRAIQIAGRVMRPYLDKQRCYIISPSDDNISNLEDAFRKLQRELDQDETDGGSTRDGRGTGSVGRLALTRTSKSDAGEIQPPSASIARRDEVAGSEPGPGRMTGRPPATPDILAPDDSSARDARENQRAFKEMLIARYGRRCAVTRTSVEAVLEAAHIHPYACGGADHPDNGLLLRVDIHRLFDADLVRFYGGQVVPHPSLQACPVIWQSLSGLTMAEEQALQVLEQRDQRGDLYRGPLARREDWERSDQVQPRTDWAWN